MDKLNVFDLNDHWKRKAIEAENLLILERAIQQRRDVAGWRFFALFEKADYDSGDILFLGVGLWNHLEIPLALRDRVRVSEYIEPNNYAVFNPGLSTRSQLFKDNQHRFNKLYMGHFEPED